jgi:hypothetical protein
MCICVPEIWQGGGRNTISTYSWPITNHYPPYSMKELGCINSVHTLFSECARRMHNVGYICMTYLCNNSHYSLHYLGNAFGNRIISRGYWPPCLPDLKHVIFFVRHIKGFKIIWSKAFGMSCLQFQQNLIMPWAYLLNTTHVCKPKESISSMNMVSKSITPTAVMWTLTDGKLQRWWALHSPSSCTMIWM